MNQNQLDRISKLMQNHGLMALSAIRSAKAVPVRTPGMALGIFPGAVPAAVSEDISGAAPTVAFVEVVTLPNLVTYFCTLKTYEKYQYLLRNQNVALAAVNQASAITVQIEGRAFELTTSAETANCRSKLLETYPESGAYILSKDVAFFKVIPTRIRYADYGQEPPFTEEVPTEDLPNE